MRAILTRARGQTLDSLFSLTGAFPPARECEKISSGVSAEGSEMRGSRRLWAPNINPGSGKLDPHETLSILTGFFEREMSGRSAGSAFKGGFQILRWAASRASECILKRAATANTDLSGSVKQSNPQAWHENIDGAYTESFL